MSANTLIYILVNCLKLIESYIDADLDVSCDADVESSRPVTTEEEHKEGDEAVARGDDIICIVPFIQRTSRRPVHRGFESSLPSYTKTRPPQVVLRI
jgi:hypothetical protein